MDTREENKILIRKYIDGKCSKAELIELKHKMSVNDLSDLFGEVMDEVNAEDQQPEIHPDTDKALQHFHGRLSEEQRPSAKIISFDEKKNRPLLRKYMAYAASILILLSVTTYFIRTRPSSATKEVLAYQHFSNPKGKRSKILLPDGSHVYLGAGSTLSYPEKFAGQTRELKLEGEAFFEVTKDPSKPFIIHTGNISTMVLGTSFKVDAFTNKPVSVLVSTGKVRVDRKINNKLESIAVLLPGQFVTWNEVQLKKETGTIPVADVEGWKSGRLVFRSASLNQVTEVLERWYNINMDIKNPKLAEKKVRVNLTTDIPLDKVMKILSVAGNFHYKINQSQVHIF